MRNGLVVCLMLVAATGAIYAQTLGFAFVDLDDPLHVTANVHVQGGLTTEGVAWAFRQLHAGYWIPLTWLSHMLDSEIYGLDPAGHHATNALLHALNALLLFGLLRSLTGATWRSAFAAALFALHPLRVESVAWVTERKDVLSTAFGLSALWLYTAWTRRAALWRYALAALCLALSLLAKPMLVTLPGVMLLLDYWPLGRLRGRGDLWRRLLEKLPLLALCAVAGAVTFVGQRAQGAVAYHDVVPFGLRVANALVSYARYLGKFLWPTDLAVVYPHPDLPGGTPWSGWEVAGAAALLALLSALAWRARGPVLVGWLWFLGALLPVIGLVQAGQQAMADRFTYFPAMGLCLAVAWEGARRVRPRAARALLATALLGVCAAASWSQARVWRDSIALYEQALTAAPPNPVIRTYLARLHLVEGRIDEAIGHYRQTLAVPGYALPGHYNLGFAYERQGRPAEARRHYRRALALARAAGDEERVRRLERKLGTAPP